MPSVTLIDNYDSFTCNLVHYLGSLGADVTVVRNDARSVGRRHGRRARRHRAVARPLHAARGRHLPRPDRAPRARRSRCSASASAIRRWAQAFGGDVVRAPLPMHGKVVHHPATAAQTSSAASTGRSRRRAIIRWSSPRDPARRPRTSPPRPRTASIMGLSHRHLPVARRAVPPREHRLRARPDHPQEFPRPGRRAGTTPKRAGRRTRRADAWTRSSRSSPRSPPAPALARRGASTPSTPSCPARSTPAQIGGFLMALRVRGETVEEITGAVTAMRDKMLRVEAPADAIDIVGTGGDGPAPTTSRRSPRSSSPRCGVQVAKHGNRAASSRSGASDVLTALGVKIGLAADAGRRAASREAGVGFMMAPTHHAAMRHVGAGARRARHAHDLQPARPAVQPGRREAAAARRFLARMAGAPGRGAARARLRARLGGARLRRARRDHDDRRRRTSSNWKTARSARFEITPEDVGLPRAKLDDLKGGDPAHNAAALRAVLDGERTAPIATSPCSMRPPRWWWPVGRRL